MESVSLCQICKDAAFKYICPNCEIPFCSVKCYKNIIHKSCSEKFYRNCVIEKIATQPGFKSYVDNDDIKKIYGILQEFEKNDPNTPPINISQNVGESHSNVLEKTEWESQSDDEMEESELPDLYTRLQGINLDDADAVWSRLSDTEMAEFRAVVQNGNLSQIVTLFTPWWTIQAKHKLIEDICDNIDSKSPQKMVFCNPEILKKIEPIDKLIKQEPSSCVRNNLINILGAYTCTARFFNGEHASSAHDAYYYLVTLSATLRKNFNFHDEEQAIKSIIYEAQFAGLLIPTEEYSSIHQDVQDILNGPFERKTDSTYILSALSDVHRLLTAAKLPRKAQFNAMKPTFSQIYFDVRMNTLNHLSSTKCTPLIKKIEFFLSYVKSKKYLTQHI